MKSLSNKTFSEKHKNRLWPQTQGHGLNFISKFLLNSVFAVNERASILIVQKSLETRTDPLLLRRYKLLLPYLLVP